MSNKYIHHINDNGILVPTSSISIINADGTNEVTPSRVSGIETQINSNTSSLSEIMLKTDIKGTNQFVTTNSNGDVISVEHKDLSNNVIRRDIFDYSISNIIIEMRTIVATGLTLTYKYHTDTLEIEVI